jgi:hypothetical protein
VTFFLRLGAVFALLVERVLDLAAADILVVLGEALNARLALASFLPLGNGVNAARGVVAGDHREDDGDQQAAHRHGNGEDEGEV